MADPPHPRAAGIMWPLIVERRVTALFDLAIRPDEQVKNQLFQPSGALGSYGVKIQLAYLLGWLPKETYDDLVTISKIRNRFAHVIEVKDFSDQKIAAWLQNLQGSRRLPEMIEQLRKEGHSGHLYTLERIAEEPLSNFQFCISQMLYHLDRLGAHMKRNLESLPESWLMGQEKPVWSRGPAPSDDKSELPGKRK